VAEGTLNQRDAKLVQWLGEAHAKEAELEADLTTHIALTEKQSYKKRLRAHLTETRDHKRRVASRIKKLGGVPLAGPNLPGPRAVGEAAGKAVAAVKGQVGTARAAVTSQSETHVRNAQEELREEAVEIALYNRLEALANELGDKETVQLAKAIRRDEERMAKYLDAELKRLVKDVVRSEIPRDQRPTTGRRRRRTSRRSTGTRSRSTGARRSRSTSGSGQRGAGSRRASGSSRSTSRSRSSGSSSTRPRSSSSRSSSSRSSSSRGSGSRSSGSRSSSSRRSSGGTRGGRQRSSGS
jgi:ferritin-like metal-binding protein YciE